MTMPLNPLPALEPDLFAGARRCAKAFARDCIGVEDVLAAFAGQARDVRMAEVTPRALGRSPKAVVWPDGLVQRWRTAVTRVPAGGPAMPYERALEPALTQANRGAAGFDLAELLGQLAALGVPAACELRRLNPPEGPDVTLVDRSARLEQAGATGRELVSFLQERVLGQEPAIRELADAQVAASLRTNPASPRAIVTLMGPPGCGKTWLARSVAAFLETREDAESGLLVLDMATFTGHQAQEKLWGFSRSYSDARPGILTGQVKRCPGSVILIDEVEKASPESLQSLLGVLDRGRARDDYDEAEVDFTRATLIFTSNLGQARLAGLAEAPDRDVLLDILASAKGFPPGYSGPPTALLSRELVSRLGKGTVVALVPPAQEHLVKLFGQAVTAEVREAGLPDLDLPEDAALMLLLQHAQGLEARKAQACGTALGARILLDLVRGWGEQTGRPMPASLRVELDPQAGELLRRKVEAVQLRLLVLGDPAPIRPVLAAPGLAWQACATAAELAARLTRVRPDAILDLTPASGKAPAPAGIPRINLLGTGPGAAQGEGAQAFLDQLRRGRLLREQARSHRSLALSCSIQVQPEPGAGPGLVLRVHSPRETRFVRHQDQDAPIGMMEVPELGFAAVVGQTAAKRRLAHVARLLRQPGLDGLPAKGYLLAGPPGTGKTMLARALAGEAGVPFFAVGPGDLQGGPARISALFALALEYAPSVVFFDEIDAIGSSRALAGHTLESRQALNTLLTHMDGIRPQDRPVFVLAATNRPDLLDAALLRPGRFDAVILLERPDLDDRRVLLRQRLEAIPEQPSLDLEALGQRTLGFSQADLDGLVREARTNAALAERTTVTLQDLDQAFEAARLGSRAEGVAYSPETRRLVAAHEAGHALVRAALLPGTRVTRIDIIPRVSGIGGVTENVQDEAQGLEGHNRRTLQAEVAALLGGRAGEFLLTGSEDLVTDGCQGDLAQADRQVRLAITRGGLDPELGLVSRSGEMGVPAEPEVQQRIDAWITQGYRHAIEVLRRHRDVWEALVDRLVRDECLEGTELQALLGRIDPVNPESSHRDLLERQR
jgi:cell division protease FtsH